MRSANPRRRSSILALPGLAILLLAPGAGRAQSLPDQGHTGPEDIPEGYLLVDGDMLIPVACPQATYETNLWPNGVIPFEFDANVVAGLRGVANPQAAMRQAMNDWEAVANVRFVARTNEGDYLHIRNSTGNSSFVGRQGGRQIVNIFNWDFEFIMAHELGHALGYFHEQSRTDRGGYVAINTANISPTACGGGSCNFNFQVETASDNYGPYDFDSLMHYGQCAFSVCANCPGPHPGNCLTITVLAPYDTQWQTAIGQDTHLSHWDGLVMSFLYPEHNWRFMSTNGDDGGAGSFLQPWLTLSKALQDTPSGGHLWILKPSSYTVTGLLDKPMTMSAPLGGVVLGK